jgi:pimeloyl-ACP methyl ester carboxylesterase
MSSIDRDGVAIHFTELGQPGDGQPNLLFTHGFAASSRMFERAATALASDHHVATWDLRGHGDSDYPIDAAEYSVPATVDDMVAVLDATGMDRAALAGHSVGGFLTLELYLAHPERASALILIDTGPGYRRDDARAKWNDMAEAYAVSFERRGLDALGDSEELDASAHRDPSGLVHAARGILAQRDSRVIDSLSTIDVPTLVMVGELDANYRQPADYLASHIPGAELAVIDGAGHAPNLSAPDEFVATVRSFLAGQVAT